LYRLRSAAATALRPSFERFLGAGDLTMGVENSDSSAIERTEDVPGTVRTMVKRRYRVPESRGRGLNQMALLA
jgi:hypothetical protein